MDRTVLAVDFEQSLSQALTSVTTFVPKLLLFLVILFVGWLIAKAVAKIVTVVLNKVGFARAVDRAGLGRILAQSQYDATQLVAKVLYYFVLLIALQAAFGVFPSNPIGVIVADIVGWLPSLAVAIIIIIVVAAIASAVRDLLTNMLSSVSYGRTVANIAAFFLIGLGVVAALNQVGVAAFVTSSVLTAVLAAIVGITIVGVGGGLIRPMQDRWGRWLSNLEEGAAAVSNDSGRGNVPPPGGYAAPPPPPPGPAGPPPGPAGPPPAH